MDLQKAYDFVEWKTLEIIMAELSFPPKFIRWNLLSVETFNYKYCINGNYTRILKARRGLRQGDRLPPCNGKLATKDKLH